MVRQETTPVPATVSAIVSGKRRPNGSGSIHWRPDIGRWVAAINLANGRRVSRRLASQEEGEAVITALINEHADELGYFYAMPRPFVFGNRERRPRQGISPRLRFRVFARDGFRCRYCGAPAPEVHLVLDHVIPVVRGGADTEDNLVTACHDCNLGKADLVL